MSHEARSTFVRRALLAYVSDRNRIRTLGQPEGDGAISGESKGAETSRAPEAPATRLAVPIPDTLDFGRSAGTWRDRSDS